ncbi:DUF6338 family protein [Streptomyces sp. CA-179760]|uniref:DUF6338 family protein n=1 Tax=Streptomyces sp. CA-179760 TaxID=3240054 RepID=UPI003D8C4F4A
MPTTFAQLAVVITAVLPGVTYQFTREHARGPSVLHTDLGERLLRALAASLVLDIAYVLVFGRVLTDRLPLSAARWEKLSASPRPAAVLALLLLIVVPAAAACAVSLWQRRGRPARYVAAPSAWDHVFAGLGPCFLRARLKSGSWVGGWYGTGSYAASHPASTYDLFLESAWRLAPDGRFLSRVDRTQGLYVRLDDIEVPEFLTPEQR